MCWWVRCRILYKGVRVIKIIIVEDVLVCEQLVRHGRLVHLTFLGQPRPPTAGNELVEGKVVFLFVGLRRVLVVGVLLQIVLLGLERGQAPELQDAPVTGHGSEPAGGHQLFATMSSDELKKQHRTNSEICSMLLYITKYYNLTSISELLFGFEIVCHIAAFS